MDEIEEKILEVERIAQSKIQEETDKTHFRPITLNEVFSMKFPKQKWVIESLIPTGGITLLSGSPGHYKSWLFMEMARSITEGLQFLNHFPVMQSKVLLVDEENHLGQVKDRFSLLGLKNRDHIFISSQEGMKVSDSKQIASIIAFCKENDVHVVFFDSLVRIHTAEENDAGKMAQVFGEIKKLCKENISVVIAHHNRKSGTNITAGSQEKARGSSEISAALDSQISVTKQKDGKSIVISNPKARYCQELESFEVCIESDDESFLFIYKGKHHDSETAEELSKQAIVEILSENEGGLLRKEIAVAVKAKTGIGDKSTRSALKSLAEDESITCTNDGGNAQRCKLQKL